MDQGAGIAVDSAGNAYVSGMTNSLNFPTQGPIQSSAQGILDGFVTKLSPSGNSLVYSTYLGGSDSDVAWAIALDASSNAGGTSTPRRVSSANACPYIGGWVIDDASSRPQNDACGLG